MPTLISEHAVYSPKNLDDALRFLAENVERPWRPLAGGTDIMVGIYRDQSPSGEYLNLRPIAAQLSTIAREGDHIRIGALATMSQLRESSLLAGVSRLIGRAASEVGAVQIQNRATVGGNIVNGSPAGDTLPVWLALNAELELASVRGVRVIPYSQFMIGYRRSQLLPDELLTGILLRDESARPVVEYFRKVAPRAAQGISKLVFAGRLHLDCDCCESVRLAFGSMGPMTVRAYSAEQFAEGRARSRELGEHCAVLLTNDLHPIDDRRSTAEYRMRVARNLVREFLAGGFESL